MTGAEATVVAEEESSKRPVIVQISEGLGSAVFSLVHLEFFAENLRIHDEEFDAKTLDLLRQSADDRISSLSQILQLLGMNCLPREVPELTPIFLLANQLVSTYCIEPCTSKFNPFSAKEVLIDFTLSNARRFYSSKGNPLALKGLKNYLP